MADVLRILDRFHITGRGTVYLLKVNKDVPIHIGDVFFDLRGNQFKVKGIEMDRRFLADYNMKDTPIGILFETVSRKDVEGNILVRDLECINFLFCNHPLYKYKVDEDYKMEYQAAGLHHSCALFSYEDMEKGKLSLYGEEISGLTIYRGWMMKPEMYKIFYNALEEKGIILINNPEEYERYHLLPGWYKDFEKITAESIWETQVNIDAVLKMIKNLEGSYIVKDFVKSRKHEWYDACYISNINDKEKTSRIVQNFIHRQGNSLVGGIVLRKFINLKHMGFHEKSGMPLSEEYRVFVYAGRILILDSYWGNNANVKLSDGEYKWIEEICKKIKSNFVTLDIARKDDGNLIILELGDGQVSGLQKIPENLFYSMFPYSIPVEELFTDNILIMASEPLANMTPEKMLENISHIESVQQLVDIYAGVHNKFWYIEDDIYDYEEGTKEYTIAKEKAEKWADIMEQLEKCIIVNAKKENLMVERQESSGLIKQLIPFMEKYGYKDCNGWWVKI